MSVACGNGTQHDLLIEEGIEAMDAFVALTDVDEENIDNTVSPRQVVAGRIISYSRALANTRGSNVLTLYQLVGNQVEALEFAAKKQTPIYNKPLKDLTIKKNCLIACIIRNNEVIIPGGNTQIELGDHVVVVTTHKNFDDLTDAFA